MIFLEGFEGNVEDEALSAEILQSAEQSYARFYEVEVDAVTARSDVVADCWMGLR